MPGTRRTRITLRYLPALLLLLTIAAVLWTGWSSRRDVHNVSRFERGLCAQVNIGRRNTRIRNAVVKELVQIQVEFLTSAIRARLASAPHESDPKLRASDLNAASHYKSLQTRARLAVGRLHASPAVNCESP